MVHSELTPQLVPQLTGPQRIAFQLLLITSLVVLIVGIYSPLLSLTQLWFFRSETSLAEAVRLLFEHGEWLLASVIALFAIVVPVVKSLATLILVSRPITVVSQKRLNLLGQLGKWSMLDVFIVAFLITATKLSSLAQAEVQYGLYLLLIAAISNIVASALIDRQIKR